MSHAKIGILFWEGMPSPQAGGCFELVPTNEKHSWVGGRKSDYPHLDPKLAFEDKLTTPYLSRLHFTIYYDLRHSEWILIDGGVFKGEEIPHRSKNGVWVKNDETSGRWEKVEGQIAIHPQTSIWIGPGFRMIISEDCQYSTVGGFLWEDEHWKIFADPDVEPINLIDETIFRDLISQREVPEKSPTMWSVVQDWSDWLQSSPTNAVDLVNRVMVVGCLLLAIAMGLTYLYLRNGGDLPGVVVEEPAD